MRRIQLRGTIVSAAVAAAGIAGAAALSGMSPERAVISAFDHAFTKRNAAAAEAIAGPSLGHGIESATFPRHVSYDGIVGSEAFWLGVANPAVATTVAIGQPLTVSAAAGFGPLRLVITDIREEAYRNRLPASEASSVTEIDVTTSGGRSLLIICRAADKATPGEFRIRLAGGQLALIGWSAAEAIDAAAL